MLCCRQAAHRIETCVVGSGVVGLAIARSLSKAGHEVIVLEEAGAIGSGISSRNSEVIHAGLYYSRESQPYKSRFCVEGKRRLYEYCRERDIPHKNCGKLLVATDAEQRDFGLPKLVELATRNGVGDLSILSEEDVKYIEPEVRCAGAVLSPSTGIVDSHSLMLSLLGDAEDSGAVLALQSRVNGGRRENDSIVLEVDGSEIACDHVVIAAGLSSHAIARKIITTSDENVRIPRQFFAKGNYYKLENQSHGFSRLVYPLPDDKGGLGIHATIDLSGTLKFGPDVEWLPPQTTVDDLDLSVDRSRADLFYDAVRRYWPHLSEGNLVPDYSGIRPKLIHPDIDRSEGNSADFAFAGQEQHGVQGLLVCLGIESPGLTSCLAIGDYAALLMQRR